MTDQDPDAPAVVDEWRVTGQPGGDYPFYDFTYRSDHPNWPGVEAERCARSFVARMASGSVLGVGWTDVKLEHRTVTYSPWVEQP